MKELTEADKKALERLPKGMWFEVMDIHTVVPRAYYRCDRLEEAGVLESRVVGKIPALTKQWRIK